MTKLDSALLNSELSRAGYAPRASFHGEQEPVVLVVERFDDSLISGRYFPSRNAILVCRHRRPEVTRALVNHELSHYLQYVRRCGCTCAERRKRCGYVGDHDRQFYEDLERLHRRSGVRPSAARVVEEESGYDYPRKRWSGKEWP